VSLVYGSDGQPTSVLFILNDGNTFTIPISWGNK